MFRRLALFTVAFLLFSPSPAEVPAQTADPEEVVAIAKVTFALRADSSFTAASVATIPMSSQVTVARCTSDWCLVRTVLNEEPVAGWVHRTFLDMSATTAAGWACIGCDCRGHHGCGCGHGCSHGSRGHGCKHGRCR